MLTKSVPSVGHICAKRQDGAEADHGRVACHARLQISLPYLILWQLPNSGGGYSYLY
jgi:hypothetical protein